MALKGYKSKSASTQPTDEDWDKLREIDPAFAFFEKMPDSVVDSIEAASKRIRGEKLRQRA